MNFFLEQLLYGALEHVSYLRNIRVYVQKFQKGIKYKFSYRDSGVLILFMEVLTVWSKLVL